MIRAGSIVQKVGAICCALMLPYAVGLGQTPLPQQYPQQAPQQVPVPQGTQPQAGPLLSPEQLDNLVAPIALYPDPLLGQVLAASTYPLEIAEAQQWMQRNTNLQGSQLMDAARQQNWDPSVQALVAFPDVMKLLGNDLRWTTDLGNAFLGQQSDVMSAVQAMRARAQNNGKLQTTAQQVVTTENQNGQSAIQIQPADPQVIYVPVYQPQYVYGPSAWGAYPDLWYPPGYGYGYGFGFGFLPGIYAGLFFPGWLGWGGWGGWGWGLGWFGGGFGRGLFVNAGFFNHFGFSGGFGGGFGRGFEGHSAWAHDPGHRMGVPYANRAVASRFNSSRFEGSRSGAGFNGSRSFSESNRGAAGANRSFAAPNRGTTGAGSNGGWRTFNGNNGANRAASNGFSGARQASPGARQATPGVGSQGFRGASPSQGFRGASPSQGFRSSPSQSYSAPRGQNNFAARSYSAPRSSAPSGGGSRSFSGGSRSFSGGSRSFSGGGGHPSGGGGHSSGGGGGHHR